MQIRPPEKLESPIGMHDGHVEEYRRTRDVLRVHVRTWMDKVVRFAFVNPVYVRDIQALGTDLEQVVEVFDGVELSEAQQAMRAIGCNDEELGALRLFRFISIDSDTVLSVVAESVEVSIDGL